MGLPDRLARRRWRKALPSDEECLEAVYAELTFLPVGADERIQTRAIVVVGSKTVAFVMVDLYSLPINTILVPKAELTITRDGPCDLVATSVKGGEYEMRNVVRCDQVEAALNR